MQIEWKEKGEAVRGEAGPGMLRGTACPCPRQDYGSPGGPLLPAEGLPVFSTLLSLVSELLR